MTVHVPQEVFVYRDCELHAEELRIADIAAQIGTPFYCYSTRAMQAWCRSFTDNLSDLDHLIAYSVKANPNTYVVRTFVDEGCGADVVSGGELRRAVRAGTPPERIVFSGVGKTAEELALALSTGIRQFNVESTEELCLLNSIAVSMNRRAPVCLRINPDIAAGTHTKISTGRAEDKFGMPSRTAYETFKESNRYGAIDFVGLDVHIGSQINELTPFEAAFQAIAELICLLRSEGYEVRRADIGGGIGVAYPGEQALPVSAYCELVRRVFQNMDVEIIVEPGRALVAMAGCLVSRVLYVKAGAHREHVILDAAMNDFMRPAIYDAHHEIIPLRQSAVSSTVYDIAGPVCEATDVFARERSLATLRSGDLIAIMGAGAYGASLSNEYNSRPLVPEVLVKESDWAVIRNRGDYDTLLARDLRPHWMAPQTAQARSRRSPLAKPNS